MAGGGVASLYDPLDVTQFTPEEMRAGAEAAETGTYATVHAYTPRAVRQLIAAGVRCIEHGQLLDDATVALMAEKNIWWSLQPFLDIGESPFGEGAPSRRKELEMFRGTDGRLPSGDQAQGEDRLGLWTSCSTRRRRRGRART